MKLTFLATVDVGWLSENTNIHVPKDQVSHLEQDKKMKLSDSGYFNNDKLFITQTLWLLITIWILIIFVQLKINGHISGTF